MPPKKRKAKKEPCDGKIKNMYEKIPADLLDKVENPRYYHKEQR